MKRTFSTIILLAIVGVNFILFQNFTYTKALQQLKIIDSDQGDVDGNKFTYSYAPSLVLDMNGKTMHSFTCTTGVSSLGYENWDAIRYSYSNDYGRTWSIPKIVLKVTDPINERSACDPSVVYIPSPNGNYYYMYYSASQKNIEGVINVARSASIEGPYLKYTKRGTWEQNPPDPQIMISYPEYSGDYSASQSTVVYKDGLLYFWHTQTAAGKMDQIYFQVTNNPLHLGKGNPTNVKSNDLSATSVDIKYNPLSKQFIMYSIRMEHYQQASIIRRVSSDGLTWSAPEVFCDENCTPDFANNIGALGTPIGFILPGNFIAYATPYDLRKDCNASGSTVDKYCWGMWDTFGAYYSKFSEPEAEIRGFIDSVSETSTSMLVSGWACSSGAPMSIGVHIYVRKSETSTPIYVGKGLANLSSESAVSQACSDTYPSHRYKISISKNKLSSYSGYSIYAYGISPFGLTNLGLKNSGKFKKR